MIEQKINLRLALSAARPVWLTTTQWCQMLLLLVVVLVGVNVWRKMECVYLEKKLVKVQKKHDDLSAELNALVDKIPASDAKVTITEAVKQLTDALESRKALRDFLQQTKAGEKKLSQVGFGLASVTLPTVSLQSIIFHHQHDRLVLQGQGENQLAVTLYLQQLQHQKTLSHYRFKNIKITANDKKNKIVTFSIDTENPSVQGEADVIER